MALDALREALATVDGNQSAFQRKTGVKQQTVSYWLARKLPVSLEHVPNVAAGTGVPVHRLRPDFFKSAASSHLLPEGAVAVGTPIVPGDRRAISQCVKS